ncbi:MAG: LSU ribosomal protein L17p, partial [uncultured Microvirga sp.]
APRQSPPQTRPHGQPPHRDVRQHGGQPDQARADRDHPAQGEGAPSLRREADHARQARRPARPPPGDQPRPRRGPGPQAVRRDRPALRRARGRLHPRAQGRLPPRRQRAHGRDRVRG